jgi:hypothetical protein
MARELESKDDWEYIVFDENTKQFVPVTNGVALTRIIIDPLNDLEKKANDTKEYDC